MASARSVPDDPFPPADRRDVTSPGDGDLVVTREGGSSLRHTVRQLPREAQVALASRGEALRLARGYARARGVDVWYSEDGAMRCLESFRPVRS